MLAISFNIAAINVSGSIGKHAAICKKRAAELRDEILFKQPESSHFGDCPICLLPLPIDTDKSSISSCCSKMICNGCVYANILRNLEEDRLAYTCPFCRHPLPKTEEEAHLNKMKRVAANDPIALREMGKTHYEEGEYDAAFEYWTKAAGLGDAAAHYLLSILYFKGQGVDEDEKKLTYHLEEAAIAGHPTARFNLACYEGRNNRIDRAVKHLIIAANLGYDDSIKNLRECYTNGEVSKEDFAAALRAHHAAVDATKSPQREKAQEEMIRKAEA